MVISKKIFLLIGLVLILSVYSCAQKENLQFRLVLTSQEAETTAHDKYLYKIHKDRLPEELLVAKEVLLSDSIDKIIIWTKPDSFPIITIKLTKRGKNKLEEITKQQLKRRIALIFENKVLIAPKIMEPIESGQIQIVTWQIKNEQEAKDFAKKLGLRDSNILIKSIK